MFAEGAVLVPSWRAMPPEAFLSWYAANAGRLFNCFGGLEVGAAVLAIAAAVLTRSLPGRSGAFFIAAAGLAVAVLAPFLFYFGRVNASFAAGTIAVEHVGAELTRWGELHWVRTAIGIAAFTAAILGVRAFGEEPRSPVE